MFIVASNCPLPLNTPIDEIYEGPQTDKVPTKCRIVALRITTREEYLKVNMELWGDKFLLDDDLRRGFYHYYEITTD